MMGNGERHFGIVLSAQARVGTLVRMLSTLLSTHTADDLCDHLLWLALKR
jgi:hypothetical protein